MGRGNTIYADLIWNACQARLPFPDVHLAASILGLALAECEREGTEPGATTGLDSDELGELYRLAFPAARVPQSDKPTISVEEQALRDILWMYSSEASIFELLLSRLIARRCQRPNHLWQDLGLADRGELSALMQQHFPALALKNSQDMKWKKFFYRMMCGADGFRLCAAPVCGECDDFDGCFGAEEGEALLARIANGKPRGGGEARL